jgi:hypothetical protein
MESERPPIPVEAWESEPSTVTESTWTEGGEGWHSWNVASPEREFCEFAAALVALVRPKLVVETGVGQGFLTRRVLAVLPGRYLGYESDEELRARLRRLDVWGERMELASGPQPSAEVLAECELAIIDSEPYQRFRDVDLWREHAPAGGYVLVHDARPDHPVQGGGWRLLARHLGDEGVFLGNPRGSWLYRKPLPPQAIAE